MRLALAVSSLALLTGMLASCDHLSESRVRAAYITTGGGNARIAQGTVPTREALESVVATL